MKKTCLIVRGKKQDDKLFRPATAAPDMHWAYQLLDTYSEYETRRHIVKRPNGIAIHWGGQKNEGISVRITSDLWKDDEACFEHLMKFIRDNDLTYEFPFAMQECRTCEGHPDCVANEHQTTDSVVDTEQCAKRACAL